MANLIRDTLFALSVAAAASLSGQTTSDIKSTSQSGFAESVVPVLNLDDSATSNPWTHLKLLNNPRNFQFAIVSDRTGGVRPGVFEDAVQKLNLLQPEFVMSVGDLIMGYTTEEDVLNAQWAEFMGFVKQLKMPFFFVPGNHDMANPVQRRHWVERFGREYYHFVYGDVLFLCANSEDPKPGIGAEQVEYFRKALDENKDVRWTLVFLHRPLWAGVPPPKMGGVNPYGGDNYEGTGWEKFEALLQGRKHTVFAGHNHVYTKFIRNDSKYIILSTTGGGSPLRGATSYGEFDHVSWVTMTDDGPLLANIALGGIWDENVRTQAVAEIVAPALRRGVATERIFAELPIKEYTMQVRLTNDADVPMTVNALFENYPNLAIHPSQFEEVVPPNSVTFKPVTLEGPALDSTEDVSATLFMNYTLLFKPEGEREVKLDGRRDVEFNPLLASRPAQRRIKLDGPTREWGKLPVVVNKPGEVVGQVHAYKGRADGAFQFATSYDAENLYVAVNVDDNKVLIGKDKTNPLFRDGVELVLDPRQDSMTSAPQFKAGMRKTKRSQRVKLPPDIIRILARADGDSVRFFHGSKPTSATLAKVAGKTGKNGYSLEFAIPISLLDDAQNGQWTSFRLNLGIHDDDTPDGRDHTVLWWRPEWSGQNNYPRSGTFIRKDALVR